MKSLRPTLSSSYEYLALRKVADTNLSRAKTVKLTVHPAVNEYHSIIDPSIKVNGDEMWVIGTAS